VDEQGRDNLPRPIRKTDEPEKPLNYLISDLVATNARVRYENRVRNIDVNLPVAKVTIQGDRLASDFDESPQADVALHARVDAARAAAIARFTEPISGLFDIDGTAKGNLTAPTLQAQIRDADVRFWRTIAASAVPIRPL
jgi:hypothetical protein